MRVRVNDVKVGDKHYYLSRPLWVVIKRAKSRWRARDPDIDVTAHADTAIGAFRAWTRAFDRNHQDGNPDVIGVTDVVRIMAVPRGKG